ncbi:MAG: ABC transporter permease [Chloroflexota bacterium]|jgi:peptide/nickel transport system permease protein
MNALKRFFRDITQYPSAIVGLVLILMLVAFAVYAVATIPYAEAIRLWRGGEAIWGDYPRNAAPAWTNWFSPVQQPETLILTSDDERVTKEIQQVGNNNETIMRFSFDYHYDTYPQEMIVFFTSQYAVKQPHVSMKWIMPDGRELRMSQMSLRHSDQYRFELDTRLARRIKDMTVTQGLFSQEDVLPPTTLKGTYTLQISALKFEPDSTVDARLVIYGQVHGLAGTDHVRRDLMVAMLWGAPIALAFGLLAALGTSVLSMIIAAVGVWFGGVVDDIIQRITEVNLVLPLLPILIMIGTLYSRTIWVILGAVIALSIFSSAIKTYRAIFLQIKEAPYIEAARSYGASSVRIIFNYLIPRIIPVLIPGLVVGVPSYVFLEASLAVLGLGDPVLPTWGKVINDAQSQGALFNGHYYWVLQPAVLLMVTGLAFSMVGFALDRIFNPRLRGV